MRQRSALAPLVVVALLAVACASSRPDTYTNVGAGTSGGKTATGKVVSFTDTTLTLETTTGREVIGLTSATEGRNHLMVGAQVAVDFQRSSGRGEAVATRVRPASG